MTTATLSPKAEAEASETEAPDFDALETDIQQRLAALREQRQSGALDAITDAGAAKVLKKVEAELADAEAELGRLTLARAEVERREQAALQAAKDEAQQIALDKAQALKGERLKLAKALDRAIDEFIESAFAFREACQAQRRELAAAGLQQAAAGAEAALGLRVEGSIARAINGRPTPFLDRMAGIPGRFWRPVADTEAELRHF
jgi:hypothetical protein